MKEETTKTEVIAFLMSCLRNIRSNIPDDDALIKSYEDVLYDLRNYEY